MYGNSVVCVRFNLMFACIPNHKYKVVSHTLQKMYLRTHIVFIIFRSNQTYTTVDARVTPTHICSCVNMYR